MTITERHVTKEGLYANYGSVSDDEIGSMLEHITPLVRATDGKMITFCELSPDQITEMKNDKREFSFIWEQEAGKERNDIEPFAIITVLVKPRSRFFVKADVGEVFDQMNEEERKQTRAFFLDKKTFRPLPTGDGDGCHYVARCTLYK